MKIIRTKQTNKEYQYSAYKVGWVFEVINDYGEYYTGNKITYSYGSKKLKKIFSEKKMSVERRFETPVVVDAVGRTLWIPGVSRTSLFIAGKETGMFSMSVSSSAKS